MSNVKIILLGDATEGLKYAPTAMWYAKKMRIDGLGHGMSRVLPVAEGVMLRVNLDDNTGDKAYIEAGGSCPLINTNSFLDTFKARVRPPGHTPRYLINKQLAEELREVVIPPATEPSPKLSFIRTVADPDTKTLTVRLPIEATLTETTNEYGEVLDPPQKTVDYSLFKETYDRLLPTKFTGLMRRVVQATMATDTWTSFAPTINPVAPALAPINYQYGNSWGCVKRVGADDKNKYYFIEIGVQSVYYVPADYCVHKVKVKGVDTDAVILRSADTSKKVLIGTIPAGLGSSWDTEMGWAFSYNSPEASIVLNSSTTVLNQIALDQEYVTVSLLTVTFGFDGAGIPNSATLTKTTPTIFYHNTYLMDRDKGIFGAVVGTGVFHVASTYIDTANEKALINATVDFGRKFFASESAEPPGYVADKIPVYVYYTETGRHICEYSYKSTAGNTENRDIPYPTNPMELMGISRGSVPSDKRHTTEKWYGNRVLGAYTQWGFSIDGSHIPAAQPSRNETLYVYSCDWAPKIPISTNVSAFGTGYYTADTTQYGKSIQRDDLYSGYVLQKTTISNVDAGATTSSVLTLSVCDRECALVLTSLTSGAKNSTTSFQYGIFVLDQPEGRMIERTMADYIASFKSYTGVLPGTTCSNVSGVIEPNFPEIVSPMYLSAAEGTYDTLLYASLSLLGKVVSVSDAPNANCGTVGKLRTLVSDGNTGVMAQAPVVEVTTTNTSNTLKLYSHSPTKDMYFGPMAAQLFRVHQPGPANEYPLSYIFMQAAFDPSNYVMHSGDLNSALVVKFQGKTYDVEHTKNASPGLFGFLGVV